MVARLPDYTRVLVPFFGDGGSDRALDIACRLASERRAAVVALTVIEVPPTLPLDAHMTQEEERARRLLEHAAAVCDSYGVRMKSRRARAREAATAILQAATENDSQLVVLGAPQRPRPNGHHNPFGSTVEAVLRSAPCRVMVVTDAAA